MAKNKLRNGFTERGVPRPMVNRRLWTKGRFGFCPEARMWAYDLPDFAKKIIEECQADPETASIIDPREVWYFEQRLERALARETKRWTSRNLRPGSRRAKDWLLANEICRARLVKEQPATQ